MSLCLIEASSFSLLAEISRGLSVLCGRCIVVPRLERGGPGRSPLSWVVCSVFMERDIAKYCDNQLIVTLNCD